ncbi:MAG: ATP-dependent helicase [Lewinellaceae bacterium]|nr:ATP-dependent helicase [Phaeodactylibacter sp.]MCB9041128.1 ATP-dependent helicase [Lewinellaceae bacterium]
MAVKLTDEQQAIVEHDGGHAKVLAVAGSGKTLTMGHRIAYLTQEKKVTPRRIRVLMFNRLAKEQFVDRLMKLGFGNRNLPYVSTFHSFAYQFVEHLQREGLTPRKKYWIGEDEERRRILLHKVVSELRREKQLPPENSILHNTNRVNKDLVAFKARLESDILLYRGTTGGINEIYREMAQEIIRLVKRENVPPTEIWVLGRMYAQLVGLEIMLLTFKVPCI